MQLETEQMVQEKVVLMEELSKTKRVERLTKEELSQARLDQSLNIEELLK